VTREDIIWLAGLLEGEGCFWTYRTKYSTAGGKVREKEYPAVNVQMVDLDIVERVAALFAQFSKGGKCAIQTHEYKNEKHKTVYIVSMTGWTAVDIMRAILPWMGERRTAKITELIKSYEGRYRKGGNVCKRGHEFTPENTEFAKDGSRFCRTCAADYPSNDAGDTARYLRPLRKVV
jgi:hypothetical protein